MYPKGDLNLILTNYCVKLVVFCICLAAEVQVLGKLKMHWYQHLSRCNKWLTFSKFIQTEYLPISCSVPLFRL